MDGFLDKYAQAEIPAGQMLGHPRNREIIPQLRAQKDELQKRINKIDSLLLILEKNPDFAKFFDLAKELV